MLRPCIPLTVGSLRARFAIVLCRNFTNMAFILQITVVERQLLTDRGVKREISHLKQRRKKEVRGDETTRCRRTRRETSNVRYASLKSDRGQLSDLKRANAPTPLALRVARSSLSGQLRSAAAGRLMSPLPSIQQSRITVTVSHISCGSGGHGALCLAHRVFTPQTPSVMDFIHSFFNIPVLKSWKSFVSNTAF